MSSENFGNTKGESIESSFEIGGFLIKHLIAIHDPYNVAFMNEENRPGFYIIEESENGTSIKTWESVFSEPVDIKEENDNTKNEDDNTKYQEKSKD